MIISYIAGYYQPYPWIPTILESINIPDCHKAGIVSLTVFIISFTTGIIIVQIYKKFKEIVIER